MEEDKMIENIKDENKENIIVEPHNKEISEEPKVNQEKNNEFTVSKVYVEKQKSILPLIIMVVIFLIALILSTGFAVINLNNQNIVTGVSIRKINVSGLTEKQSKQKLLQILENELDQEINLIIDGKKYSIIPKQFEVNFNVDKATETAYQIGRGKNIFIDNYEIVNAMFNEQKIDLEMQYNEDALDSLLNDINAKLPNAVVNYVYSVEDDELIITRGKAGTSINIEATKAILLKQIKNGIYDNIEIKTEYREPDEIDIQKIYEDVHKEPKNAYFIKEPFELFPHENGIDFDIESAKKILKEEKEEYVIPIKIIEPEILTKDLGSEALTDLLSSFQTKYDASNVSRTTNLKLATQKINGVIVMPGEIFSYNKTVGKRTVAAGYKEASGYSGGKVVQMLGGGICQISSTLYDAVVYANLEIVERYNHMFIPGYVKAGKDATVVYGSLDFKFKNTRNYPILIKANVKGGISTVEIYGIKEEPEYEIEILVKTLSSIPFSVIYEDDDTLEEGKEVVKQYGANGCKTIAYKVLKLNGVEQSREVLSTDTYSPMNKIIRRGTKVTAPVEKNVETEVKPAENEQISLPQEENENSQNTTEMIQPETQKVEETAQSTQTPEQENVTPVP